MGQKSVADSSCVSHAEVVDSGSAYRRLLDHCPDAICIHCDGQVVYANPAGLRWIAAGSLAELEGRAITDFVHPDSIPPMLERIAKLEFAGQHSEPSEATMLRLDGSSIETEAVSLRIDWDGRTAYQVIFRDLSAQAAARETLLYQSAIFNNVSDAIIAVSTEGLIASWNPGAESIYNRPAMAVLGLPLHEALGVNAIDLDAIVNSVGFETAKHHDGAGRQLIVRVAASRTSEGYVVVCSDNTALREAERQFRTVVDAVAEGIIVVNRAGKVTMANPAAKAITQTDLPVGIDEGATTFLDYDTFDSDGTPLTAETHLIARVMATGVPVAGHIIGVDVPHARRIWLSTSVRLMDPTAPDTSSVVCSFTDISEQQAIRSDLEFAATHDSLTTLPNRGSLVARLGDALASRPRNGSIAALFIDLDRLKLINDSLGHSAGDRVLQVAARRLKSLVSGGDFVGRVGGDEFVAIVFDRPDRDAIEQLADELHRTLRKSFVVDGELVDIGASIGVAVIGDRDIRTADDILRDADIAMYAAKTGGRGRTQFYVPGLREQMRRRMRSLG